MGARLADDNKIGIGQLTWDAYLVQHWTQGFALTIAYKWLK